MEEKQQKDFLTIVQTVKNKASLKQRIFRNSVEGFANFKGAAGQIVSSLKKEAANFHDGVKVEYKENGEYEFHLKIGGDVVLFHLHSNVFDFDQTNALWKTGYLKEDPSRSYCSIINVYNFLADSLKYNRYDDTGYLIARIFINKENHYFVEGRKQLNFVHNDFINQTLQPDDITDIIQQAILYSMDFDLFAPPYKHVQEISVGQLLTEASGMRMKTGKRMGFKFNSEV